MTTTAERLLVDTNILVEATDEARRWHRDTRALVESGRPLVLTAQVVREYLVAATRPVAANGLGLPTADALDNMRQFRSVIRLLPEEKPVLPTLIRLLETIPCAGKRIHDAHLMATAQVHGVKQVVSLNVEDLNPFRGDIDVITPTRALAQGRPPRTPPVRRQRSRSPKPRRSKM